MQRVRCKYCGDEHECTRMTHAERAFKRWAKEARETAGGAKPELTLGMIEGAVKAAEASGVGIKPVAGPDGGLVYTAEAVKSAAVPRDRVRAAKERVAAEFMKRMEKGKP